MEWWDRFGAMYQFINQAPALAHDMAAYSPQTDLGYDLAYAMQNTSANIDVYPADTQSAVG